MKPRSDSILKLRALKSPEFGEKVIEWLHEPARRDDATGKAIPRTGGAWHAKEQLAADGIKVSDATLSEFYSWWQLRKTFQRAEQKTSDFEEFARREFSEMAPERIHQAGQNYFTMRAVAADDSEEYREMEKLRLAKETAETKGRQKDEELRLAERRVKLLEAKAAEALATVESTKLSDAEKASRIREIFKK